MFSIVQTGTFDLVNFGDLLMPLVAKHELTKRLGEVRLTLASPVGGSFPPDPTQTVFRVPRVEDPDFYSWAATADAIVVGGGDIIRFDDAALAGIYGMRVAEATAARAFRLFLLDIGELAAHVPVFWNAVGVPHDLPPAEHAHVRDAVRHVAALSVRDDASRARLEAAGVELPIDVVPDSAFAVSSLFPAADLTSVAATLKREGLFPIAGRVLALHAGALPPEKEAALAAEINGLVQAHADLSVVLVPITICHGDLETHARIAARARDRVTFIPRPLTIPEVIAVIAHADAFVGASLHGNIIAAVYGRDHLFSSITGPPAAKIVEYARKLKRGAALIDSIDAFGPLTRELLEGRWPVDTTVQRSMIEGASRHFDRLAEAIQRARGTVARDELATFDRMHRDSLAHIQAAPAAAGATGVHSGRGRVAGARVPSGLPTISALIPVYNGRRYLREAVASVASQTLLPCELILVDDGSDDDAISLIDQQALPFPVRIVRQENAGQSAARNHGARLAQGELLALLDQDDRWYAHHLERLIQPFREFPELGFTYSNLDEIDANGRLVTLGRLNLTGSAHPKASLMQMLSHDMFILPSATLIRRDALLSIGGFDEQFSGYEDDDLFIRLFRSGLGHRYLNESLSQWRIYNSSSSYTSRMDVSRRRFAEKLMATCPNDPELDQWWVRDQIAPRFFHKAVHFYHRSMQKRDWQRCDEALDEIRTFGGLMMAGPKLRLRMKVMRYPRLYRRVYRWWSGDPALDRASPAGASPRMRSPR